MQFESMEIYTGVLNIFFLHLLINLNILSHEWENRKDTSSCFEDQQERQEKEKKVEFKLWALFIKWKFLKKKSDDKTFVSIMISINREKFPFPSANANY